MAHLQLQNVRKSYGAVDVIKGVDLEIESGEFMVFVGPSGCGKSTLLRLISGLEDITSGDMLFDNAAGQRARALEARHRHGVPVLRALPAHEGLRQHGLRHEAAEGRRRRHQGTGDEGGEAPADRPPARPAAEAALRRPAPARGDRPRHRPRPAGLPVRRAALQPRRRAARRDPARDRQAAPLDGQRDDGLRHPRPGRGDDARRPDLRAARRPRHAGGLADRALRAAELDLRRRLHRQPEDELPERRDLQGLQLRDPRHPLRAHRRRQRQPDLEGRGGARREPRLRQLPLRRHRRPRSRCWSARKARPRSPGAPTSASARSRRTSTASTTRAQPIR